MIARAKLTLAAGVIAFGWSCNPVLTDQINALQGDAPGVRNGPLHRPGEPCLLCHDGKLTDPNAFSVAGTVYRTASSNEPLPGATILLTGADGKTHEATTNEAGNFYLTPNQFVPKSPFRVSVSSGGTTVTMASHIGWNGACAGCHTDPAGPESAGHVYFEIGDGGTP